MPSVHLAWSLVLVNVIRDAVEGVVQRVRMHGMRWVGAGRLWRWGHMSGVGLLGGGWNKLVQLWGSVGGYGVLNGGELEGRDNR